MGSTRMSLSAAFAAALAGALVLGLAACGSSGSVSGGSGITVAKGIQTPQSEAQSGGKRGGTLTVLNQTDFEQVDPGQAYFNIDYQVIYATQRPLFSYKPNTFANPSPDMASAPAQISSDGKTITIQIRGGVHFSPPVNREVTSADVAYAIERGANPNVGNAYFEAYFSSLVGFKQATGGPFPGISTPNKSTIVFHLSEPKAPIVLAALVLPLSAPVPAEFAKPLDAKKPTEYGNYQVATGPYMLKSNSAGKVLGIGYQPGKSATLVRNPNWSSSTDSRPAYLDQIDIKIGGDPTVIGRQVLEGSDMVQNEAPAQSIVKLAYEKFRSQLQISPGAGDHYIAVDNKQGPFANVNVRKAFWAALDRSAMNKARGGELVTNVMTHFIYPEIPGFEEAGGLKGPQVDYNDYPEGNTAVAAKYMRLAGYPSGRYTGAKTLEIVGSTGSPSAEDAEIVNQTLKNLGFKTKFNLVDSSVMYAKYCGVPAEAIDVCPSVAWIADFGDGQAVLDVPFNGKNIVATGNNNWGLVNDPEINKAMDAAELVVGVQARAAAWAQIDRKLVAQAAAIPFDWDKAPGIESKDVAGVGDLWNSGGWDYSYTSLK
ncbi:MAG TPA: ABC transporter substrate-binding protein [Solirubrobacteraceae bacterium]